MLFRGLADNWMEFWFYVRTRNPFLQPTYFSLFGIFTVQRYGKPCPFRDIDLKHQLEELTDGRAREDGHHFFDSRNFTFNQGALRMIDYGNKQARKVIEKLHMSHIDINNIACIRSYGTKTRRTIARCHALGKLMQRALGIKAVYVLEFLSERFDKMSEEEKTKVIIHELMHIPKTFGGGFKHHDFVCDKNINFFYKQYQNFKK